LPGKQATMPFLLHPQLEIAGRSVSDATQYSIKTRQVVI
jgi:hypothetical protein